MPWPKLTRKTAARFPGNTDSHAALAKAEFGEAVLTVRVKALRCGRELP